MAKLLGGGGGKQTQTSEMQVTLPGYVQAPLKRLIPEAEALANQEYEAYGGQRIQGFSPEEIRAFQLSNQLVGESPDMMRNASGITQEVGRRGMEGFTQAELDPWMNPYTQNVLDISRRRQFENYDQSTRDFRQRASEAGSFGGSRFALGESQMADNFQRQLADSEIMGLSQAYQQGLSGAMGGTQLAGQSAMDYVNQANALQGSGMQDIGALTSAGMQQRQLGQQQLDVDYQNYLDEKRFPYEQQSYLADLLLNTGQLTKGETKTTVSETEEADGGFLSKALGIASLVAAPFTGGASLMGGLGSLGGIASSIGGGLMGASTGISAGLGMGSIGRMALGGASGMYGPGFNDGGQVRNYSQGGTITGGDLSGKIGSFMRFLEVAQGATGGDEQKKRMQFIDDGIIEDPNVDLNPEGTSEDEYSELWRQINQGKKRLPSPEGDSPLLRGGRDKEMMNPNGISREDYLNLWESINNGETNMANPPNDSPLLRNGQPRGGASNSGSLDEDTLNFARTLYGEARGEDEAGQAAVAHVINNRAKEAGVGYTDVVKQPWQFSAWNKNDPNLPKMLALDETSDDEDFQRALKIAREVSAGRIKDPTKGATHYFNPSVVQPDWMDSLENVRTIGSHKFGNTAWGKPTFNNGGVVGFSDGGLASFGRFGGSLLRGTERGLEEMLIQRERDNQRQKEIRDSNAEPSALQRISDWHERRVSPFSEKGPELYETNPFDTTGKRALTHLKNIPGLAGIGARKYGEFFKDGTEEIFGTPRLTDEEALDPATAGFIKTSGDARQLYNRQQQIMDRAFPQQQEQQQEQQQKPPVPQKKTPTALTERVDQLMGRGGSSMMEDSGRSKTNKTEEKKGGINYPLVAFGAALLTSDGDFFKALGEGAQAAGKTSMSLKEREKEFAQQQITNDRAERMAQIQEGNYRINRDIAPYKRQLAQAEATQIMNKIYNGDSISREDRAKLIIEMASSTGNPEKAEEQVDRLLGYSNKPQTSEGALDSYIASKTQK